MTALENIDINPKDQNIDRQEIEQALKPNGFLNKEKNIQAVNKELQSTEKTSLTTSLESCLTEAFEDIITKETLSPTDIQILMLWNTLLGENDQQEKEQLQDLMSEKISIFMDSVGFYDFSKMEEEEKKSFYNMVMLSKGEENGIDKKEYKNIDMDLFFVQALYEERENTKSKNIQENIANDVTLITYDYVTNPDQVPLLVGGQYKFTPSEIAVIQFLAKTQGEDIQINGERAKINVKVTNNEGKEIWVQVPTLDIELYKRYNQNTFDEKSRTTNVWIYREELKWLFAEKKDTGTETLSTYFETELEKIADQDIKNKVLAKFGEDTKRIRTFGQSYSKNEKDALKYYFSLLVDIELETDATKKQTLITEANTKITSIQNNVQEFVTKDKGYVLNSYKQKIKIQENKDELTGIVTKDAQGFVEGTTKEDIEKMIQFAAVPANKKYIESNYPDFQDHLYKAIIEENNSSKAPSFSRSNKGGELFKDSLVDDAFIKNLLETDQNFKDFYSERKTGLKEKIENKEHEGIMRKLQTTIDIGTQFISFLQSVYTDDEFNRFLVEANKKIQALSKISTSEYINAKNIDEEYVKKEIETTIDYLFYTMVEEPNPIIVGGVAKKQSVNIIYKMLFKHGVLKEKIGIENSVLKSDIYDGIRIIEGMFSSSGGGFGNRWESEEKTNEVKIEIGRIFTLWDENNEIFFGNKTFGNIYTEMNKSEVLDTMKTEDKNTYPSLYQGAKQIDRIISEMINEEGMLDGTSKLAGYLKEYNKLSDSLKNENYAPSASSTNTKISQTQDVIIAYFSGKGIAVDSIMIGSLAKNYILLQQQFKDTASIEKQREKIKTGALEKIKIEQERIITKREGFNQQYATEESVEEHDREVSHAQLILEVIENGQAKTIDDNGQEKIITIADLISDEGIDASIKLQQAMTLGSILKGELTTAFIRGKAAKNDLIKIENKPEAQRNGFEQQIHMISDNLGGGSFWNFSDENQNTLSQVAETLIVQAILIAVSGGIGSLAEAGLVNLLAKIPGVAESLALVTAMSRAGKGFLDVWKVSKIAAITGKAVSITGTIANGIVFHIGNTIGNGLYAGQSRDTIVDSLDPSPRQKIGPDGELMFDENGPVMTVFGVEYLRSIAFISVMHLFSPITARLNVKLDMNSAAIMKEGMPISTWTKIGNVLKAEGATLPGEIAGMMATEKTLDLLFDGDIKEITGESFLNTLTLIIGLRLSHRYLPPFHQIKAKIDQKTFDSGTTKITDVDINKAISSMKDSPSSIFVNSKADKVDKTSFENDGKSWSFAIKEKGGRIVFFDRNGKPLLGVTVDNKSEGSKSEVNKVENKKEVEIPSEIQDKNLLERGNVERERLNMVDILGKREKITEQDIKNNFPNIVNGKTLVDFIMNSENLDIYTKEMLKYAIRRFPIENIIIDSNSKGSGASKREDYLGNDMITRNTVSIDLKDILVYGDINNTKNYQDIAGKILLHEINHVLFDSYSYIGNYESIFEKVDPLYKVFTLYESKYGRFEDAFRGYLLFPVNEDGSRRLSFEFNDDGRYENYQNILDEFYTESISNPEFAKYLFNIKIDEVRNESVYDKSIKNVVESLGLSYAGDVNNVYIQVLDLYFSQLNNTSRNLLDGNKREGVVYKNVETKSAIDPKIVEKNALLEKGPRLIESENLLPGRKGELVDSEGNPTELGQKILDAHDNSKGGEIYKITPEQLTEKVRILKEAGFKPDEIRILIENGICGKVEAEVLDVDKNGVFDGIDVEMMGDKRTVKFDRSKMDAINNEILSISNIEEKNKKIDMLLQEELLKIDFSGDIGSVVNELKNIFGFFDINLYTDNKYEGAKKDIWSKIGYTTQEGQNRSNKNKIIRDAYRLSKIFDMKEFELNTYINSPNKKFIEDIVNGKYHENVVIIDALLTFLNMIRAEKGVKIDVSEMSVSGRNKIDKNVINSPEYQKSKSRFMEYSQKWGASYEAVGRITGILRHFGMEFNIEEYERQNGILSNKQILEKFPEELKKDIDFVDYYLLMYNYGRRVKNGENIDTYGISDQKLVDKLQYNYDFFKKNAYEIGKLFLGNGYEAFMLFISKDVDIDFAKKNIEYKNIKDKYEGISEEAFFESLEVNGNNELINDHTLLLTAMIEANKKKDWSNNEYNGIFLEKERDFNDGYNSFIDFSYDESPAIYKWLTDVESFGSQYLGGNGEIVNIDKINLDVKKIMVYYGLKFDTAFLVYKMEFLKTHKSDYFSSSNNPEAKYFSEEQGYDNNLPYDELIALRQFQTGYSLGINRLLRNGSENDITNNRINIYKKRIDEISSAINKNTLEKETTLYRAIYREGVEQWKNKKVGDEFLELGFASTSLTDRFPKKMTELYGNESIMLKIKAPVGTPYINMEEQFSGGRIVTSGMGAKEYKYTGQDEILLQKDTKFIINNIFTDENGIKVYEVEIQPK